MIDAALGNGWDMIGEFLAQHGCEDSSGIRRCVVRFLAYRRYSNTAQVVGCSLKEAERLRAELVKVWGEFEKEQPANGE